MTRNMCSPLFSTREHKTCGIPAAETIRRLAPRIGVWGWTCTTAGRQANRVTAGSLCCSGTHTDTAISRRCSKSPPTVTSRSLSFRLPSWALTPHDAWRRHGSPQGRSGTARRPRDAKAPRHGDAQPWAIRKRCRARAEGAQKRKTGLRICGARFVDPTGVADLVRSARGSLSTGHARHRAC